MAHDIAPGAPVHIRQRGEVILGEGIVIPAVVVGHNALLPLGVLIHRQILPVPMEIMHRTDDKIVPFGGLFRVIVLLDAKQNPQLRRVFALQLPHPPDIVPGARRAHAVPLVKAGVAVTGKAQGFAACRQRRRSQLLGGVVAVAEGGVCVQIVGPHEVIFSCLTL